MRTLEREFGGRVRTFTASMKASLAIAETVGDPLMIVREAGLEQMMHLRGIPYTPKIDFDIKAVSQTLWVGLKHSVDKEDRMTLEEVQEAAFDMGWVEARELASEYLALISTPRPTELPEGDDGEEAEGN